jgi:hypothetical protein
MLRHDAHVDPVEAQEVVRLAAERQSAAESGPTVNGLAEALGLPPEEVERLLIEVRRQRGVITEPVRRRIFGDRSAALSAALALALFLVTAAGLLFYRAQTAVPPAAETAVAVAAPEPEKAEDFTLPPDVAPHPPVIVGPDTIFIEPGQGTKREEIARLEAEIARIQAEKSKADLDQRLKELRKELEWLEKEKASEGK